MLYSKPNSRFIQRHESQRKASFSASQSIVRTTKVKEGESAFLSADSMQESVVLVIAEHTMAYQKPVKNLYADILAMYLRMVKRLWLIGF